MRRLLGVFYICLVLSAMTLLASAASFAEDDEQSDFPYVERIAPGNAMFIHGLEFRESVEFDWRPGDSLRVQGVPVLPTRPVPEKTFPEERLAEVYGQVDFVSQRAAGGETWRDAVARFTREQDRIVNTMHARYWEVLDSTGSEATAGAAAVESVDHSLFEGGKPPTVGKSFIKIHWAGLPLKELVDISKPPVEATILKDATPTAGEAMKFIQSLGKCVDGSRGSPWVIVLDRRGRRILAGGQATEALQQIEDARHGELTEGPLDEVHIREIVGPDGGERQ